MMTLANRGPDDDGPAGFALRDRASGPTVLAMAAPP